MKETCPVCRNPNAQESENASHYKISCPRCGVFQITDGGYGLVTQETDPRRRASASHQIRRMQRKGTILQLDSDVIRRLADNGLPTVQEQADNLVIWLGLEASGPGENVDAELAEITATIGAQTDKAADLILREMHMKGIIECHEKRLLADRTKYPLCQLTFDGWTRCDELLKSRSNSRRAFMAMEYGNSQLDEIVRDFLKPAVIQTGFTLHRLDENHRAGLIDNLLRVEIRRSRFLLADLTHQNNGAYWEAGFAEGLGKEVIYLCRRDIFEDPEKKPHFDTNHHQCIIWDPAKPEETAWKLKAAIRDTFPGVAVMEDE